MLPRRFTDIYPKELARDRREFFNSLLGNLIRPRKSTFAPYSSSGRTSPDLRVGLRISRYLSGARFVLYLSSRVSAGWNGQLSGPADRDRIGSNDAEFIRADSCIRCPFGVKLFVRR